MNEKRIYLLKNNIVIVYSVLEYFILIFSSVPDSQTSWAKFVGQYHNARCLYHMA